MRLPQDISAILHLRSKVHKWKNISILLVIFVLMLAVKLVFGHGLTDKVVEGDYIASIKIEGAIFEDDFRDEVLEKLAANNSVKAVIVTINSPGGGIVGSEILFHYLYKISRAKPMVVVMESLAASGAYMAAVASDHIIAHNGTLTGSIGVLLESPEVTDLAKKIGVSFNTYKSSPLKGSPSPFEKPSNIVNRVISESIADSYHFFVSLVRARRGDRINKNFQNIAFDGRVFTGRQALQIGLVDEIGGKDQAMIYLANQKVDVKKLPIKKVEIVKDENGRFLERFLGFLPFFNGAKTAGFGSKRIMAIVE
jgi:protease-4